MRGKHECVVRQANDVFILIYVDQCASKDEDEE